MHIKEGSPLLQIAIRPRGKGRRRGGEGWEGYANPNINHTADMLSTLTIVIYSRNTLTHSLVATAHHIGHINIHTLASVGRMDMHLVMTFTSVNA